MGPEYVLAYMSSRSTLLLSFAVYVVVKIDEVVNYGFLGRGHEGGAS